MVPIMQEAQYPADGSHRWLPHSKKGVYTRKYHTLQHPYEMNRSFFPKAVTLNDPHAWADLLAI